MKQEPIKLEADSTKPAPARLINRAALHRLLRSMFKNRGVTGPLPRGGLAALEALLEQHAITSCERWAQDRKWKQSGGMFGQPELPASKKARKRATKKETQH